MSFTPDGILSSPWPRVQIPNVLYHCYLLKKLNQFDKTLLCETEVETERSQTYGDVFKQSASIAVWFQQNGLKNLDRVAIYSKNQLEYLPSFLGILRAGGVVTYLRQEMLVDKGYREKVGVPRFVFASSERCQDLIDAGFKNIIVYGSHRECISFDALLALDTAALKPIDDSCPKTRLALVAFTGGTTGNPKPIMLSHHSLLAVQTYSENRVYLDFNPELLETERPIHLSCFPTTHVWNFLFRVVTLVHKPHNLICDDFVPETICQAVQKYKVNTMSLVAGKIISFWRYRCRSKYDMSTLKDVLLVAGFLPKNLHQTVKTDLKLRSLAIRLGMSDCCGTITTSNDVFGSIGNLCPNTEARIVNPESLEPLIKPGQIGELSIRCSQRMLRYYNMPEKTDQTIDNEGFLRTADLVYTDDGGNLFYVDRLEEVIRHRSGLTSSMNIEWNLIGMDNNVKKAAVIGIPNPDNSDFETAIAFVLLHQQPSDPDQYAIKLLKQYNDDVSVKNERLHNLKIIDIMPRTVLGKPLKRKIKHDYINMCH